MESPHRREAPMVAVISTALAICSQSKILAASSSSMLPLPIPSDRAGARVRRLMWSIFGVLSGLLSGQRSPMDDFPDQRRCLVTSPPTAPDVNQMCVVEQFCVSCL
jgi:hypothetical protein